MKREGQQCWACRAVNDSGATRCRICWTILPPAETPAAAEAPAPAQAPMPAQAPRPTEAPAPAQPSRGLATGAVVALVVVAAVIALSLAVVLVNLAGDDTETRPDGIGGSQAATGSTGEFADWITFTDPDGRFTASFPRQPEKQDVPAVNTVIWIAEGVRVGIAVSYTDLPGTPGAAELDAMLDGAVGGAATAVGGEVGEITVADHDGHPGRRARITVGRSLAVSVQVFAAGDTLWGIQAVGFEPDEAALDHVLDSLVLG